MGDTKPFEPRPPTPAEIAPTALTPSPCGATPPGAPAIEPGDETLPAIGARLADRYVLERLVGRGGMGAIYAASDERLRRKVAIKVMLGSTAQIPGFTQRFEREARIASRINHPSCVTVHDFGVDGDRHYLVLEWVEGRSLGSLIDKEGALLPERACALLAQVCDGLGAAHAVGVVHRDVKPDNVMVLQAAPAPAPQSESAKLVDFGIALVADPSEPHLTQAGLSIGSPNFDDPQVLSFNAAARYLEVSNTTIKRLAAAGVLPMSQMAPFAPWELKRSDLDVG
jgi:serine/threonine-protein kinase